MIREKTMQQFCSTCDVVLEVAYVTEYDDKTRQLISDKSVCPCGKVLWNWCWNRQYHAPVDGLKKSTAIQMDLF